MTTRLQQTRYLELMGITVWRERAATTDTGIDTASSTPAPVVEGVDLDQLERQVAACTACALHRGRTRTVFGVGNRKPRWMIIGEAPGADEDRQGEPFVGRAGGLLNSMLLAAGFARDDVYIANIVKCRPSGNRNPQPDEISSCSRYLNRQIELLQPSLILAVGRVAAHALLKTELPLGKLRGRLHHYEPAGIPLVVTYHPAYLLRKPGDKARVWEDLKYALSLSGVVQ